MEIIGVVSNHNDGGVRRRAELLHIPFYHLHGQPTGEMYQWIARETGADFFALSGWLKLVVGLDMNTSFNSKTVFNIHPGPLPEFGGHGFHGHHVHEAVTDAFKAGRITHTAVCMHFVSEAIDKSGYDRGPVFFRTNIPIKKDDTSHSLAERVNGWEHHYQPIITSMVVNGEISWDGRDSKSLVLPEGYTIVREQ